MNVGKSTLSKVLAGSPSYKITKGTAKFKGFDLAKMSVDKISLLGVFLSFQYPIEIPMLSTFNMLKAAINERRRANEEDDITDAELEETLKPLAQVNPKP